MMNEIIFLIEEALEGGYTAKAIGESIFTEADTMDEIKVNIKEAVECHFDEGKKEVLFKSDVEALIGKRPYEEKKALDIIDNPKDAVIEDPIPGIVSTPA